MFFFQTLMQKEPFAKTGEADCENLFYMGGGFRKDWGKISRSMKQTSVFAHRLRSSLCSLNFLSAARVSENLCNLEYLFSRMNEGSYGPTEPHLWLVSRIPTRTWDDCRTTSERKSRTPTYDDLVDLLTQLTLERENDSHMEKFLKRHLGRGGSPSSERGEGKGLRFEV